ncbi:ribbon-helix-helix protein, CopG family [Clostridium thermobutyricum]|uniref:ribbon-helix-helix protein, CopG family n=1 Tax=Clostridium thermobutyricum TaxID=29372 RepID=UPI0018AAD9A4|nr:ribbon-helix-helix protein, CopG family [Clostridium thermobutyricum]
MRKNDLIQIRVTSEDKKRIKEIAEKQGKSISEILCNYINEIIEKDNIKEKYQEQLDKRVVMTEKKLLELKRKLGSSNN